MEQEQMILHEVEEDPSAHTVWINEIERIASFHAVEGYVLKSFINHEFFMGYVHSLQERGFRFQ